MMRVYNNTSWRKPFQSLLFILFITTCNSIINENNNNKYFNVVILVQGEMEKPLIQLLYKEPYVQ